MNRIRRNGRSRYGFTMLEMMVLLVLFASISTLAFSTMIRCQQVVQSMRADEQFSANRSRLAMFVRRDCHAAKVARLTVPGELRLELEDGAIAHYTIDGPQVIRAIGTRRETFPLRQNARFEIGLDRHEVVLHADGVTLVASCLEVSE